MSVLKCKDYYCDFHRLFSPTMVSYGHAYASRMNFFFVACLLVAKSRNIVLYEGQRFPVWIKSGNVLVLQAVSTSPSKLVSVLCCTHIFLNMCLLL